MNNYRKLAEDIIKSAVKNQKKITALHGARTIEGKQYFSDGYMALRIDTPLDFEETEGKYPELDRHFRLNDNLLGLEDVKMPDYKTLKKMIAVAKAELKEDNGGKLPRNIRYQYVFSSGLIVDSKFLLTVLKNVNWDRVYTCKPATKGRYIRPIWFEADGAELIICPIMNQRLDKPDKDYIMPVKM